MITWREFKNSDPLFVKAMIAFAVIAALTDVANWAFKLWPDPFPWGFIASGFFLALLLFAYIYQSTKDKKGGE